jgi:hypothetical protein
MKLRCVAHLYGWYFYHHLSVEEMIKNKSSTANNPAKISDKDACTASFDYFLSSLLPNGSNCKLSMANYFAKKTTVRKSNGRRLTLKTQVWITLAS